MSSTLRRALAPKGFSLMELMITVVIVGVLAVIALPAYSRYRMRGMQAIGREALVELKLKLEQYRAETDAYPDNSFDLKDIFPCKDHSSSPCKSEEYPHYEVRIVNGNDLGFEAEAQCNLDSDATMDRWTITQSAGQPTLVTDDSAD